MQITAITPYAFTAAVALFGSTSSDAAPRTLNANEAAIQCSPRTGAGVVYGRRWYRECFLRASYNGAAALVLPVTVAQELGGIDIALLAGTATPRSGINLYPSKTLQPVSQLTGNYSGRVFGASCIAGFECARASNQHGVKLSYLTLSSGGAAVTAAYTSIEVRPANPQDPRWGTVLRYAP